MVKVNRPLLAAMKAAMQIDGRGRASLVRDVDRAFREHEEKLFSSEGSSGGAPWAALSPEYKARKDLLFAGALAFNRAIARARGRTFRASALGAANKILQLSGDMRRSFVVAGDLQHVAQSEGPATRFRIVVGSRSRIANYHYDGTARMPRRDPIAHTAAQSSEYLGTIKAFFVERMQAALRATRTAA